MFRANRLENVRIPKPCGESWEQMAGQGRTRYCESCQHSVHDFSQLTRREASHLLKGSQRVCARITYNAQGRIIFRRAPEPSSFTRLVQISLVGISALASQAVGLAQAGGEPKSCKVQVTATDQSGGRIITARATLNAQNTVGANDQGVAELAAKPGSYRLQVAAPGFKEYVKPDLEVSCDSGSAVQVNAELAVGRIREELIGVVAGGPQLEVQRETVLPRPKSFIAAQPPNGLRANPGLVNRIWSGLKALAGTRE